VTHAVMKKAGQAAGKTAGALTRLATSPAT
jgi:hypothetical protein